MSLSNAYALLDLHSAAHTRRPEHDPGRFLEAQGLAGRAGPATASRAAPPRSATPAPLLGDRARRALHWI